MNTKKVKPFSAGYFISQNRLRCFLLIFMFFLTYIAYIGGLYATNIMSMNDAFYEQMEKYAIIQPYSDDENFQDFQAAMEEIQKKDEITVIQQGVVPTIAVESVMQFPYGISVRSFRTVEEFEKYCDYMDISCDAKSLKVGSFIASQLMANNRGMKIGDELEEGANDWLNQPYTLDAITDEKGYTAYVIDGSKNYNFILMPTDMPLTEFQECIDELEEKYHVYITDIERYRESDNSYLKSFGKIYSLIVVLLAVVMAITINAAFVGMYQHRESEFAVYRAIGISKGRVIGKIIKELLLMDAIGIVFGGVVMLLAIYLLNELALIPQGWMLLYYHPTALLGMLLCNITVLVPLVLSRSRKLLKADICEY